jgi:hypothetical protein
MVQLRDSAKHKQKVEIYPNHFRIELTDGMKETERGAEMTSA